MSDVSDLFCVNDRGFPIEGYLGKPEDCMILFVLKEPDTGGYGTPSTVFWMESVIKPGHEKYSGPYLRTLGIIAAKLMGKMPAIEPEDDFYKEVLKSCAYINLYPFSGLGTEGENYKKVLNSLHEIEVRNRINMEPCKLPEFEEDPRDASYFDRIASNRLQIIKTINCNYVVTVCGAFEAILDIKTKDCKNKGITLGNKQFLVDTIPDTRKAIAAYYHPKYNPKAPLTHFCMNVENVTNFLQQRTAESI